MASEIIFPAININDVKFCQEWSVPLTSDSNIEIQAFIGDMKLVDMKIRMRCKSHIENKLLKKLQCHEYDFVFECAVNFLYSIAMSEHSLIPAKNNFTDENLFLHLSPFYLYCSFWIHFRHISFSTIF